MSFSSHFVAGSALLVTALIPDGKFEHNWPIVALCWIGQVACTVAFSCAYTFTKELFPTPLRWNAIIFLQHYLKVNVFWCCRTIALTTTSSAARIGSICSPFINLLNDVSPGLSLVVYGSCLLMGALCSIFVWPETKKHKMTESIEECEALSNTKNKWIFCF